jgi:hypothetical protein
MTAADNVNNKGGLDFYQRPAPGIFLRRDFAATGTKKEPQKP